MTLDKIIVKGIKVFAYHGVNPEEKVDGQNFILDIVAYMPLSKAAETDNLDDTVSCARIFKMAVKVATENRYDLIETLAESVAQSILRAFEPISAVNVCVKKPEAPITAAEFDYVAVEIFRTREALN